MTLTLKPHLSQCSREEIENFLAGVQARRLAAAVTYFEKQYEKLEKVDKKIAERLKRLRDQLGNRLMLLEKTEGAVMQSLQTIQELEIEAGLIEDQLEETREKLS